jgi:hypothetical protein
VLLAAEALFPSQVALVAFGIAGLAFTANITLKAAAFFATLLNPNETGEAPRQPPDIAPHLLRPPVVSILVPMFQEPEIAARLITHLARMRYPAERLDILLLLEEDDTVTADAIAAASLPPNMRVLTVPEGHPRTKPRALNYALPFARGEIIGIYDAEDRPDPNQIAHIVRRYDEVSRDVACLQGRLDYYNTDHNLMARLFTVEYASWFRVLLPGVQRLGLFVPLGGPRSSCGASALEEVGGWDAHNVTEDAELGLRLARAGYRTELVDTTTYEEATAAVGPWIRQRSRWLKGYLITWATAMRDPRVALARSREPGASSACRRRCSDGGPRLFPRPAPLEPRARALRRAAPAHRLSGAAAFRLARRLHDPVAGPVDRGLGPCLPRRASAPACARSRRWWSFYYTLGTFAAWLGALDLMARPFFWAKTRHGVYGGLAKPPLPDAGPGGRPRNGSKA